MVQQRLIKKNDSIDFSQPRIIEVYSQNGEYRKTYTITVNVHKQRGNEFNGTHLTIIQILHYSMM